MERTLMAERVIFDNEFFKAVENIYHSEAGLVVEKGLSWKQSPDATIVELERLYKLEKACTNQSV